jgi:hypothetical protein
VRQIAGVIALRGGGNRGLYRAKADQGRGKEMNVFERIVAVLTAAPLTFFELREAVNAATDVRFPWSEESFSTHLEKLEFRGWIVRRGEKFAVPEAT